MNGLACRACRVPLVAAAGCALCDTVRRNLVVLGETDDERPSLAGVSNEAVNALRAQLRDYKTELACCADLADRYRLHDRQRAVAGALAKLLDAARKLQADGVDAVENMSFSERAELFVTWFCTLPAVYREQLRAQIDKFEAEARVALPEAP